MVTHFIILSSSYTNGTRIALDYIIDNKEKQDLIDKDISKIITSCGKDVSISTHTIQAESKDFASVCIADYYFEGVKVIKNIDYFIKLIKMDRELKGIDIAKYILANLKCTHLKLQKLVYLCYADYLCSTNKELFNDKIFAFKYGPIVESVYKKYKNYGCKEVDDTEDIDNKKISKMPSKSRILFAYDGVEKVSSINNTLKKYGNLSTTELVKITHKKNSPWSVAGINDKYSVIEDEVIKKHHCYEEI